MRVWVAAAAMAAAVAYAPAVSAATVVAACQNTNVTPTATACRGFFGGNLISGNAGDLADSAAAVNALLGTSYTGATLPILETLGNIGGSSINFARNLVGPTVFAFHVGGANGDNGVGAQSTGFFLIDAGAGLDVINLNIGGLSNARLFATGSVPEPATWAMLLVGFGAIGVAMRRRGAVRRRVRFAF